MVQGHDSSKKQPYSLAYGGILPASLTSDVHKGQGNFLT